MGFFDFFKKKDPRGMNHSISDDERTLAAEVKHAKAEIAREKARLELELMRLRVEKEKTELQAQIENARDALAEFRESADDETGDSADSILMALLTQILNKNPPNSMGGGGNVAISRESTPPQQHLTDAQINDIWQSMPHAAQKVARKLPDEQLKIYIKSNLPNIDDDSINRAIILIKER